MFKATLDKLSKGVLWGIVALTILFVVIAFAIPDVGAWMMVIPIITLVGVLIYGYLYSPIAYSITSNEVIIHRRINTYSIPRTSIHSLYPITEAEMGRVIRLFGNGGVFGYTGIYRSKQQGTMNWFVSQHKNYVVIESNFKKKYVLTPDDVPGFLAAFNQ